MPHTLSSGTLAQYVLFNLENENFVVGPSHLEAIKAYRANTGTRKAGAVESDFSAVSEENRLVGQVDHYRHQAFAFQ